MKQERQYPTVVVTKKQEKRIRAGHPWVYADEITEMPEEMENGCLADVRDSRGHYLGTGLYSEASKIKVRILDNNANETFGESFFERRVRYAVQYRKDVMKGHESCMRIIHGEADGLPGVTADHYDGILVTEIACYGMEMRRDILYKALISEMEKAGMPLKGIYERNENELRRKEGLTLYSGWYEGYFHPDYTETAITENGIVYNVDFADGQKTGFFLDQKFNRLAVRALAAGKSVLDCCTHTGSFALNMLAGGAVSVTAADISASALEMTRRNAEANHMEDRLVTEEGDVFELLPKWRSEHRHFDLIVLDPPAFTKSRRTVHNAHQGYRTINAEAMKLLKRGSYLCTCSCSHFMSTEEFREMLNEAAADAGVRLRIVEERHASPDHPVLAAVPETDYLKCFLLQIL
ncbi:MAG: class I SAM-dependent rRNA methyltransferase [Solobacterium sp.]|nr:class I SAM-dependent rRNA methyltransferase [Solobacterium sp.]